MDINALLQQFTQNAQARSQQVSTAQQGFDADTAKMKSLMQVNEEEAAKVAATAAEVARQNAAVEFRVSKAREANAAIVGLNPEDQENEFIRSMAAFNSEQAAVQSLEQQRAQQMRTIEKMQGTNVLENPLAYLVAQLALPTAAAKHNQTLNMESEALNRRNRAADNINTRVNLLRQKDSVLPANTAEVMNEITLKKAEIASKAADIQLREAKIENISKIGARALSSLQLGGQQYELASDFLNKAISLEQWKLQRAAAAEARAAAAEARKERAAAKAEGDAERELFNQQLSAVSAALGYTTPLTVTSLKVMSADKRDAIVKAAVSGQLGSGVLDTLATIQIAGNREVITRSNPGMAIALRGMEMGLQNYQTSVQRAADAKGVKLKPGEAITEAGKEYEYDVTQSAMSYASKTRLNDNKFDTTFNPYRPQYFAVVDAADAGQIPQLKGNSVVQAVKTLKDTAGNNIPNLTGKHMEQLVKTISRQVADGKLPLDAAVQDIVRFHQIAAATNLKLYNYDTLGLPRQTSAIIGIEPVTSFSQPFRVDLMDAASVKRELTRMAVEQKKGTLGMLGAQQTQNLQSNPLLQSINRSLGQ